MINNKKILILTPGDSARGGITSYSMTMKDKFNHHVDYLFRGSRNWPNRKNKIKEFFRILKDYYCFLSLLKTRNYSLVQTTTSFSRFSLLRDAIFILISKAFKTKVIVFYHGWDEIFADKVERKFLKLYRLIYFKADAMIDLSKKNVERLRKWGYSKPIYLETTVVDTKLLKDININYINNKFEILNKPFNILFLARIEISKGIYEAIDSYNLLRKNNQNISLTIAGDGKELDKVKFYVKINNIENILFKGFVEGENKIEIFKAADLYIFPSYSEGMPTSVLEAMAFGLPVVTTNVGGLSDFFINEINGFITNENKPEVLAKLMEKLFNNKELMKSISLNNYQLAQERFIVEKVVLRMMDIYRQVAC